MSSIGMAIILASIFAIMFTFAIHSLGRSPLRKMRFVLALPVSALCVLSLFWGVENVQEITMVNIVLIPYAALTCTVILLIILWLLSKAFFQIRNTSEDDYDRIENEHFGHPRMAAITKEKLVNIKLQEESTEV